MTCCIYSCKLRNYSNYSHGSYVPKSGEGVLSLVFKSSGTYLSSHVYFELDSNNVSNILDYNNGGDNPGTSCDNAKAFLTLDQTAVPDSNDLKIDGEEVITNLPDPKIDIEDNNFFFEDDETEVTVLGTVQAGKTYYMESLWEDLRDGDNGDGGKIQAQFAMSKKGIFDYNNCVQSDVVQHTFYYGKNFGQSSLEYPIQTYNDIHINNEYVETLHQSVDTKVNEDFDAIGLYTNIHKDQSGIMSYKDTRHLLLEKIIENEDKDTIAVTISFDPSNRFISYDKLKELIDDYYINVAQVQARAIDQNGDRVTIVTDGVKKIRENSKLETFVGYTAIKGHVPIELAVQLSKEQEVFLVDPSGDSSITGLSKEGFSHPLTWLLEDSQNFSKTLY